MGDSVKNKKRGKKSHFPVDENGRCSDEEPTHKKSKKKQKLNSNLIDENLDPSNTDSMSLNNSEEPGESLQKAETELTPKTKSKKKKKKNNKAEAENLEGSDEEFEESFKKAESKLTPKTKSKKKKKNKAKAENMEGSDEEPEESLQKAETELTPKAKSKKKKKKNKADAENIEESNDSVVSKTNGDVIENDSSSDESDISDGESANSVSSFNIDSYPSDDDDDEVKEESDSSEDEEAQKKRGLPIGAVPSAELEEKENRTIFVGNLPKTVDRHKLQKWFSRFGKVECVRLRSAPIADLEMPKKVAVIKKSFHENRSNISAYIRYKDIEGAQNALQANCTKYGEFTLRVDNARHKGGYDGKKAVFVGNVPFTIEENSLINLFSKCGDVESVRIIRDKQTGVGKGFGYVNFKCSSSIPLALKLDGEVLEKRELRVKPVKYNKKNSYKAQSNISQKRNNFKFKSGSKQVKSNGFGEMKKHGSSGKPPFKKSKFQGELSKRKEKSKFKKKSFATKKREIYSKILANKKKTD